MTSKPKLLTAPFPYFGGKSRVAAVIWDRLGDPDNYIEPFAGSLAVLLRRPSAPRTETANDLDCMVANFWRAVARDPEAVAAWADWPINEADLHARHCWLVHSAETAAFRERVQTDPDYHDAKIAGWWCWGLGCWIGRGWCAERAGRPPRKLPGIGVPSGKGVCRRRPHLAAGARGVHARGGAADDCAAHRTWLIDWFQRLRDRLRYVRVCCGNWMRVCDSPAVTTAHGTTAIFLDPPYPIRRMDGTASRAACYVTDLASGCKTPDQLRDEVLSYCRARGADPLLRICVAGYEGDGYEALEREGWSVVAWESQGGYSNKTGRKGANAARERLWFSPHCVRERTLFEDTSGGGGSAQVSAEC